MPVLAFRTTDPPWQNDVAPVMVAMGRLLTVTEVAEEVAEHPLRSVTVTVYDP